MSNEPNDAESVDRRAAPAGDTQLARWLRAAQTFHGVDPGDIPDLHAHTRPDERIFLCVQGVSLFELRAGFTQSRDVQTPAPIDKGELLITSTRALFTGTRQIRQWVWSELVGIEHADNSPSTAITVAGRQRVFGLVYDDPNRLEIRFNIELAIAGVQGTRGAFIERLAEAVEATRPRAVATT
jgi:hypothetical protein